ncbi:MAG: peroxiredoxin-like family protein, partial [Myxococcota bacterium]
MQLHRAKRDIEQTGARLIVIGNGQASFIAGFRERTEYDGLLYTDPSRRAYKALGLRRGLKTLKLRSAARAVGAFRKGFRQVGVQGDAMQQGGVFVVDTEGRSVFQYRSSYAGD